jgi:hypothetical protein
MIGLRHTTFVNLNFEEGDPRFDEFFDAAKRMMGTISQVRKYHHFKQIVPETPYKYGFMLDFDSVEDFEKHFEDPQLIEFAEKYWESSVKEYIDFNLIEID